MVSQNSINNTVSNADFSVNKSVAGSAVIASVNQTDNTNTSSNAELRVETGGTAGGDPFLRLNVSSGQDYSFGIDNSATLDPLKITDDADPSTGNILWQMDTNGIRSAPRQCAFSAYLATDDTNVTGNGTAYTLGTNTGLTEIFDRGNVFTSGTTFTAPVTGKYSLIASVSLINIASGNNNLAFLVTSNRTYQLEGNAASTEKSSTGAYTTCLKMLADLDISDTATVSINLTGVGGDTSDLEGIISSTYIVNSFSGHLAC